MRLPTVSVFISEIDGLPVIQIETEEDGGPFRVYLNDGTIWEGDPELPNNGRH